MQSRSIARAIFAVRLLLRTTGRSGVRVPLREQPADHGRRAAHVAGVLRAGRAAVVRRRRLRGEAVGFAHGKVLAGLRSPMPVATVVSVPVFAAINTPISSSAVLSALTAVAKSR